MPVEAHGQQSTLKRSCNGCFSRFRLILQGPVDQGNIRKPCLKTQNRREMDQLLYTIDNNRNQKQSK